MDVSVVYGEGEDEEEWFTMNCKKNTGDQCLCLKRKHGGCLDCEKKALKTVQESGRDLNEDIKFAEESEETVDDLYMKVYEFDPNGSQLWYRSAIDILRGTCKYCKRGYCKACLDCMWSKEGLGEDLWLFDEDVLTGV